MTIKEFNDKWSRNINAEYIIPDVEKVMKNNIIIPNYTVIGDGTYKSKVLINGDWYKIKIKKAKLSK